MPYVCKCTCAVTNKNMEKVWKLFVYTTHTLCLFLQLYLGYTRGGNGQKISEICTLEFIPRAEEMILSVLRFLLLFTCNLDTLPSILRYQNRYGVSLYVYLMSLLAVAESIFPLCNLSLHAVGGGADDRKKSVGLFWNIPFTFPYIYMENQH